MGGVTPYLNPPNLKKKNKFSGFFGKKQNNSLNTIKFQTRPSHYPPKKILVMPVAHDIRFVNEVTKLFNSYYLSHNQTEI